MTHLPFIQQSLGDVLSETAHLSAEEFGAYQLLCFAFWQHGALPSQDSRLARIVRTTPERWAEIRPAIVELFGDDWMPSRLAKRREEVEALHLKKSAGGRKGAAKRWDSYKSPNDSPNNSPNGSEYSNHNHNHNHNQNPNHNDTRSAYEGKAYTRTRETGKLVPAPKTKSEAIALLQETNVFPADYDALLPKLMRGELLASELEGAT